ncbi:MAG: efflux RND transporter permease subunit [Pleomorphochaeta sp.]
MNKYFQFQHKHKRIILIIVALLTVFFTYHLTSIKLNADFSTLFNQTGTQVYYPSGNVDREKIDSLINSYQQLNNPTPIEIANIDIPTNYNDKQNIDYPTLTENEQNLKSSTNLLLLISSDYFFTPVFLNTLDICLENLENTKEVKKISSVFDYITIEKKGTRLSLVSVSPNKIGEQWSDESTTLLKQRIAKDPTITGYLVGVDLNSAIFNLNTAYLNEDEIYDLLKILEPLEELGATFAITGQLPITYRIMYYLQHDLSLLLSLCFIVILIIFYMSFRSKRSMILPFLLSLLAIIWTLGTMALLGYELSLINIVTPCMVLILGSSYVVHILSEYFDQYNKEDEQNTALKATKKIYKTILLAAITTIAGFLSLLISKVDGLKEFGTSVSIGIVYCAILSLTLLPIILSYLKSPKSKNIDTYKNGLLTKTINKMSILITTKWYLFILAFVLIIIGFLYTKDKVAVDTNYMSYFPSSDRIVSDTQEISKALGGDLPYEIIIDATGESEKFFLDPQNLEKVYEFEKIVMNNPDVMQNISFASYVAFLNKTYSNKEEIPTNKALLNLFDRLIITLKNNNESTLLSKVINTDGNQLRIYFQTFDSKNGDISTISSSKELETLMIEALELLPKDTKVTFSGTNAKALKFSEQLLLDQNNSQLLAYLLVFIIASIAFISVYKGLLTLIPVVVAIMMNYIFMYLLNIPFDMVTVSFASVAIGAGVDDAIHFLLKFTNLQKNNTLSTKEAITLTIQSTGRPIVLTTLSIVLGMVMLTFASYLPIRYFGLLMSIALMDSMLATILILPSTILFVDAIKERLKRNTKTSG